MKIEYSNKKETKTVKDVPIGRVFKFADNENSNPQLFVKMYDREDGLKCFLIDISYNVVLPNETYVSLMDSEVVVYDSKIVLS